MSIDDFCGVLAAFSAAYSVPFRHYEYSEPTAAPCIAWYEADGENIQADSVNVLDDVYIRVELYVRPEDTETAGRLEAYLTENGLAYDRARSWISERHEVMMIYEITL